MAGTPTPDKINFNLATATREKSYEPYVVALADGDTIVLNDPRDLDWKELATIENPIDFMRLCVSDEDKSKLRKAPIPGWMFNDLIEDYQLHYGLGEKRGNLGAARI